jgi:poly(hydroxyalkanoate) depolymerase family esterase
MIKKLKSFCSFLLLLFFIFCFNTYSFSQTGWLQVNSFGTNPGNLNMYQYIPVNVPTNAPLVVVLHGCSQTALGYATESGWNVLADKHKFYVLYAEQLYLNNNSYCFNWFNTTDYSRDQGEVLSVKQMVDYMKSYFSIDSSKVFVSGLSAGACLSVALLGAYPDVFAAGASMAGVPYKAATDAVSGMNAMYGLVTKTPDQWGNLVRNENPTYTGKYPTLAVFQGTNDITVNPVNATELVKQWTNVHNTDQIPDSVSTNFNGNNLIEMKLYNDISGKTAVQLFNINTMQHAISVDPGNCFQQGGTTGMFAIDKNFFSSFWAAKFFGIIVNPFQISGPTIVSIGQTNIIFSIPQQSGSNYQWEFPGGVSIISGQGTSQVEVNWNGAEGFVTVTETDSDACLIGPVELWVSVTTENKTTKFSEETFYISNISNQIIIHTSLKNYDITLLDLTGKLICNKKNQSGESILTTCSNLKGIYLLKIVSKNKLICKKCVLL